MSPLDHTFPLFSLLYVKALHSSMLKSQPSAVLRSHLAALGIVYEPLLSSNHEGPKATLTHSQQIPFQLSGLEYWIFLFSRNNVNNGKGM